MALITALINSIKQLFTKSKQNINTVSTETQQSSPMSLGDRMKWYESLFNGHDFPGKYPQAPAKHAVRIPAGWPFEIDSYGSVPKDFYPVIRVDGHCFSTFTRKFKKPYDRTILDAMKAATIALVDMFHAVVGYTQSDEITIVLPKDCELFGRHCQKIASLASSTAAVAFYDWLIHAGYVGKQPAFDARVFGLPSEDEVANCIVWRERDAIKNSISNVARKFYSDKELHSKNSDDKLKMLSEKGCDFWNQTLSSFTRGMYIKRIVEERPYTPEELEKLPPLHQARTAPAGTVTITRSKYIPMYYPLITKIQNLPDVLFRSEQPVLKEGMKREYNFEQEGYHDVQDF